MFVEPLRHIATARLGTDPVAASTRGSSPSSCARYADMRMGTLIGGIQDESRGPALSLRPRGREHSKDILCRNVTIYGHCRYEDKGCAFNHEPVKSTAPESVKQRFNVDSPSFTPAALTSNGHGASPKSTGLSPKAAIAAPFKPKGITPAPTAPAFTPASKQYNPTALDWVAPEVPDFIPQAYNTISSVENNHDLGSQSNLFEQFTTNTPSLPSTSHTPQPQVNPYTQDASSLGVAAFYPGSSNYSLPLQHHLYAALGPHRDLQPNQRTARDFFISEDLRQLLQKKTEATLHTLPHSNLPPSIAHFHGLVPLVSNTPKSTAIFGYSSWIYKALSSQDGKAYCLRQLQGKSLQMIGYIPLVSRFLIRDHYPGYHLTNEMTNESAIRSVQRNWGRIRNANVVSIHLAFTTSAFGDSSLIFVTDYHPLSETLAQKHFTPSSSSRFPSRHNPQIPEQTLWSYIVQIASALKAIHSEKLAARVLEPNKVLLTGENRIRLNGCAILDVVQHDTPHNILDLQRLDLYKFGRLILALGTNNMVKTHSAQKAWEIFNQRYSSQL
ncbi:PAB-dependent poly(A)-specific ribonuclease subunit 3, partial [Peltigera leucophlebia]|nr:PAB-dependent poly(A)-specific ribonuclease subunit 3 [Peltigera leucophlebia]